MPNDSMNGEEAHIRAELANYRRIIEEKNSIISIISTEKEMLVSNVQGYLKEIENLRKDNENLKAVVQSLSQLEFSSKDPTHLSHNSISTNKHFNRFTENIVNTSNNKISSMVLNDSESEKKPPKAFRTYEEIDSEEHSETLRNKMLSFNDILQNKNRPVEKIESSNEYLEQNGDIENNRTIKMSQEKHNYENSTKNKLKSPNEYQNEVCRNCKDEMINNQNFKFRRNSHGNRSLSSAALTTDDGCNFGENAEELENIAKTERVKKLIQKMKSDEKNNETTMPISLVNKYDLNNDRTDDISRITKADCFSNQLTTNMSSPRDQLIKDDHFAHTGHQFETSQITFSAKNQDILEKFSEFNTFESNKNQNLNLEHNIDFYSMHSNSIEKLPDSEFKISPQIDNFHKKNTDFNHIDLKKLYEDFLIVGCQKDQMMTYLLQDHIDFSILFDLYTLDSNDPNNQNSDVLKFMIPFKQKLKTIKVMNSIGKLNEILFQDEASCKNFEFFSFYLNSSHGISSSNDLQKPNEHIFKNNDLNLLKETNPNLCYYYYCAKIDDFFVDIHNSNYYSNDHIEFTFYPKYFVIKTLYPFSQLFFNVMQQLLTLSKRKRIEKFLDSIKDGIIDIEVLEKLDSNGISDIELGEIISVFDRLDEVIMGNNFEKTINIEMLNSSINYTFPSLKNCPLVEAEFGFARVFSHFSFEEFLFILFSILLENTVVFVSEDFSNLSACISSFLSLIRPFKWSFPVIYSLPKDCLDMLGSPIPLLVGLNLPAEKVMRDILRSDDKKTRTDSSSNIYVFVDHNLFHYDFDAYDSTLIPYYDEFVERLEKIYKKSFSKKSSNYFKLSKKKVNKSIYNHLKQTNTQQMKEKLSQLNYQSLSKARQKNQMDRFVYATSTRRVEDFNIFHFCKTFFHSFIISKLPIDRNISRFGKQTKIGEINTKNFSSNESDIEFIEAFMKTQFFMCFLENDFYEISNRAPKQ
jgi:hypothetical protein